MNCTESHPSRCGRVIISALLWFSAIAAHAADSQFHYDHSGNLVLRTNLVASLPVIVAQPQNQVASPGASASFSVVPANALGLAYQWRFNGTNLPGANGDSLLLTNVSAVNAGPYTVVLANGSGSVTSSPALLLLDGDRDGLPDTWEQTSFGGLAQSASDDFDNDGVSNLDEFLDGTNPANNASLLYRLTLSSDGGHVDVSPDSLKYTNGTVVTLTATAFAPEIFHGWIGSVTARTNQISLVMTNHKSLAAYFQPTSMTWAGGSGSWHEPTNWIPTLVPTAVDQVSVTSGSTVTLNEPAECEILVLSGPALAGSGSLTIHSNAVWSSGTMSGSGRTLIQPGATLILNVPGSVSLLTRTLENGGTVLWTGAGSIFMNSAVITNRPGALFEAANAASFAINGGVNRFDNAGTFRKSAAGITTVAPGIALNNYNTVEIQAGTLTLNGGGLNSGTLTVPAGTSLNLGAGTFANSGSLTGAGSLTVSGATTTLGGSVNLTGSHTFSGGNTTVTGNYFCTNNTLTLSGGAVTFNGTGLVEPATLTFSSGALGGIQEIKPLGSMSWASGTMSGTGRTLIPPGVTAILNIPGSVSLATRTFENGGTVLWTGAGSIFMNSAVITNRPGALFEAANAASFALSGGVNRFDNAGTFRKSAAGTTTVGSNIAFNNYNSVELQAGTLALFGGGLNPGTMSVPAGTTLNLVAGTFNNSGSVTGAGNLVVSGSTATLGGMVNLTGNHTFSGGNTTVTGDYYCTNNTLTISGGTATFSGTGLVQPTTLTLSSGTLGGNQTVTVLGAATWSGGTMSGSGRTVVLPGVTATLNIPGSVSLATRTLENGGMVLWAGAGSIFMNSAVITNRAGALFEVAGTGSFALQAGVNRFDNAGTFRKSAAGTTTLAPSIALNNYGSIDLQSGILAANGGYSSGPNASLNCALGGTTAGTGYARLQTFGVAALDGDLSVNLLPGFTPATNDTFTVISAITRSGTFASFSYPSNRVTMTLSNAPGSVILTVTNVFPVPQPVLLTPQLVGSNALITWTATSNVTYRLQHKTEAGITNWTELPDNVTTTSNTASKLDPLTSSNRLYRVRVMP
jgi:hypothetical protein